MRKIVVIGAGYVGLVTGACFAQKGNFVIIVEKDENKVKSLLNGIVPFYEPGLNQLVTKSIRENNIIFVNNIFQAIKQNPQVIFSCVGTPSLPDGSADLSAVWTVSREVGKLIDDYILFINKSTVPVGTAKKVKKIIKEELDLRGLSFDFDVASNPEFLKEGDALNDFLMPDRVVIGVESKKAEQILSDLYKPFLKNQDQLLFMNSESAELTKYASNSMLATRISFMNQLALFADKVGADIEQVKLGMAKDKRIGVSFLNAGIGYGGSCFPKDVKALIHMGKEHNHNMSLIKSVDVVNDNQRDWFVNQIFNYYKDEISKKTIGIWGLAFKPETDDIRCAPSIDVIENLLCEDAKVVVYDPVASENIKKIFKDTVVFVNRALDVLRESDCLVILTEWKEFLKHKPNDFKILKDKVVFDGRNCFKPIDMKNNGIKYFTVGRNSVCEFSNDFCIGFKSGFDNKKLKKIN